MIDLTVERRDERYRYERTDDDGRALAAAATIREDGSWTVVEQDPDGRWAWLTLATETDLDLVGVTAAIAPPLARAGIACNVIAGNRHDHLLVPHERADEAADILAAVGDGGASRPPPTPGLVATLTQAAELVARLTASGMGELLTRLASGGATDRDVAALVPGSAKATLGLLASLRAAGLVETSDGGHRLVSTRPLRLADELRRAAAGPLHVPRSVSGFVDNGRLTHYPGNHDALAELLTAVAAHIGPDTVHREAALTARLAEIAVEPVELRRRLVDSGFVERTSNGSRYLVRPLPAETLRRP